MQYPDILATSIIILLPAIYLVLFILSVLSIVMFCCWNALKRNSMKKFGYKIEKAQDKEDTGSSQGTIELVEKIGNGRFAQVILGIHILDSIKK